jgi:UDP-N-acetylmuramoyl-tripeptide--D-alanyl-D-alanine ligase
MWVVTSSKKVEAKLREDTNKILKALFEGLFCWKHHMKTEALYELFLKHPRISTDSRKIISGSIFFALKGASFDGNSYAAEALTKGAVLAVVDDPNLKSLRGCIYVEDVLTSLQQLATFHRKRLAVPVIAITGSNGKTTTKELCRDILAKKYRLTATKGNLNNHIGVPLTILSAPTDAKMLLIEMGANHQREIDFLCRIAQPDYGAITNIGKAHLEGFGGIEGVKKGKSEMYRFLAEKQGIIFVNAEDETLNKLIPANAKCISYSPSALMKNIGMKPFISFQLEGNSEVCYTQLIGSYNIPNIAMGVAIGRYFGVEYEDISSAIASYIPENNRSQVEKRNSNTYLLDAYNANPTSMKASIGSFRESEYTNKVLILGDMFELGEDAATEHQQIIDDVSSSEWLDVIFIGPLFHSLKQDYPFHFFESVDEAGHFLTLKNYQHATILIKGSRGMALERMLN